MSAGATTTAVKAKALVTGWRYRAFVWSVIAGAGGYLAFAVWAGWRDVAAAVVKVGAGGVAAALALALLNYVLRFARWQAYLGAMRHPVAWWPSLKIYLAGFALTTTPGKAGEMLRGVLLNRRGVGYPVTFAAFLSERLSDLIAVVALALLGLTAYPAMQPLITVGAIAVVTASLVLSNEKLADRLYNALHGRRLPLLGQLAASLLEARRCHAPLLFLWASALSLAAWSAEAWAFYLIARWMELDITFSYAVFVYAVAMLAGALSFMPGGLGGTEAVMVALLMWHGAGGAEAAAATVVIRLATLWFAVAIGVITLPAAQRAS
jgi:uncharacterized membrane protein YbhN (UPF0104 family)